MHLIHIFLMCFDWLHYTLISNNVMGIKNCIWKPSPVFNKSSDLSVLNFYKLMKSSPVHTACYYEHVLEVITCIFLTLVLCSDELKSLKMYSYFIFRHFP
jgi:hypothetical protein